MKTRINCPFCYSGNYFDFVKNSWSADCEDCDFKLIEEKSLLKDKLKNISSCIFCNCDRFYLESYFFNFLKPKSIFCYLCEAEYWNWQPKYVDDSFNLHSHRLAQKSETFSDWKNRIILYEQLSP